MTTDDTTVEHALTKREAKAALAHATRVLVDLLAARRRNAYAIGRKLNAVDELFRIGGLNAAGQASETFSSLNVATLQTRETTVRGTAPGRVLAAALHPWQPRALILDRTSSPRTHRLLWLDLVTGESRMVATFPAALRTPVFDRYDLVGLENGDFALVASSLRADRHVVVTMRVNTTHLRVLGHAHRLARVVGRPYATERGLSIPVSRRSSPWQPVGLPYSELRTARWRDVEDCF